MSEKVLPYGEELIDLLENEGSSVSTLSEYEIPFISVPISNVVIVKVADGFYEIPYAGAYMDDGDVIMEDLYVEGAAPITPQEVKAMVDVILQEAKQILEFAGVKTADDIKLWWSHKHGYPDDFWICTAKDTDDLRRKYENEHKETISSDDFEENYEYSAIDEIDGYKIILEKVEG